VRLVCGRKVLASVVGLHALAGAAALALPSPAALVVLCGVALSAVAFLRRARGALAVQCDRGAVLARLGDEAGGLPLRVRAVPFLGRWFVILEVAAAGGPRYWWVARGDIPNEDYRVLMINANWPARRADSTLR
jgi:hypothetical protein